MEEGSAHIPTLMVAAVIRKQLNMPCGLLPGDSARKNSSINQQRGPDLHVYGGPNFIVVSYERAGALTTGRLRIFAPFGNRTGRTSLITAVLFRHQTTAFPKIQLNEMGPDAITRSARAR